MYIDLSVCESNGGDDPIDDLSPLPPPSISITAFCSSGLLSPATPSTPLVNDYEGDDGASYASPVEQSYNLSPSPLEPAYNLSTATTADQSLYNNSNNNNDHNGLPAATSQSPTVYPFFNRRNAVFASPGSDISNHLTLAPIATTTATTTDSSSSSSFAFLAQHTNTNTSNFGQLFNYPPIAPAPAPQTQTLTLSIPINNPNHTCRSSSPDINCDQCVLKYRTDGTAYTTTTNNNNVNNFIPRSNSTSSAQAFWAQHQTNTNTTTGKSERIRRVWNGNNNSSGAEGFGNGNNSGNNNGYGGGYYQQYHPYYRPSSQCFGGHRIGSGSGAGSRDTKGKGKGGMKGIKKEEKKGRSISGDGGGGTGLWGLIKEEK
ncbi:hypothetical protein QBC38DRAFT_453205 [Podospora fimiseda]|uniref:Uncharacterized protein n=1 Tax=Podospora fimiseda TaxID=252190 RepID=A0AAN7BTY1_9PEZI|nr:hypothetical protein QBC38DRAFT_453205 [Podospora fimiseda]